MRATRFAALRVLLPATLVAGMLPLAAEPAAAEPTIWMDRVVVQAMVEPVYGKTRLKGNYGVKQVQKALRAKKHPTAVDGWYGTGTRRAYSAWQRDLGYSGIGANGIPGPSSLTKLGNNRFKVTHRIKVGPRRTYSGQPVNRRTRKMLVEAKSKHRWSVRVTQGSYQGCSSASACTHAGGGAVDISVNWTGSSYSLTKQERYRAWRTVRALRKVGFAAWLRTPNQGSWPYHIHAVAVGDTDAHRQAANQVADYYKGKNGLANHAKDNTPKKFRAKFTWWERYKRSR